MTTQEEYFSDVFSNIIREELQTLLRTKEYSAKFLPRKDMKSIDEEIEKISDQIVTKLLTQLRAKGLLENAKTISREDFEQLYRSTVSEYFGEKREGKTR